MDMYVNDHGQYEFWRDPAYMEYVEEFGEMFTADSAEYASMMLKNADGTNHTWTCEQVSAAMKKAGLVLCGNHADACYMANLMYARHYGSAAKTVEDVLSLTADALCHNSCRPFAMWTTYLMLEGEEVDWDDFER